MEELIKNFGIDWVLLAAQIVNFLIIFWLLKKFAYKPIFAILEKRKNLIAEGVKNAEESSKTLEKALEEEKKILKKAQTQSQEILSDAQKQAEETLADAENSTKVKVEKILQDAKKEIERQTQETEKQLAAHTAQLAIQLLEKSLSGIVDTKTQKEVVEKMTKRIKQ